MGWSWGVPNRVRNSWFRSGRLLGLPRHAPPPPTPSTTKQGDAALGDGAPRCPRHSAAGEQLAEAGARPCGRESVGQELAKAVGRSTARGGPSPARGGHTPHVTMRLRHVSGVQDGGDAAGPRVTGLGRVVGTCQCVTQSGTGTVTVTWL